jgi:Flp pilus assembly protein TadG
VALVELALCITVILVILYGTIELSFMYRSATAGSTASRAGARLAAATYADAGNKVTAADQIRISVEEALRQRGSTDTPTILRIYQADLTTGLPVNSTFSACATNCIRYAWNGTQFANPSGSWTTPDACGTTLDSVGVYVELSHTSLTGIVRINRTFGERTVMRLEPSTECTA